MSHLRIAGEIHQPSWERSPGSGPAERSQRETPGQGHDRNKCTLQGVRVPSAPLPEQREIEFGERVWIDREQVQAVVSYVGRHLPPDAVWGFNFEGDRAWVNAESHVNLQTLIDEALADSEQ
jgi:hypothetical protein